MRIRSVLLVIALGMLVSLGGWAAEAAPQDAELAAAAEKPSDLRAGMIAAAAALAIGLTALGTGLAQSKIGAAGAGTLAEKPETAGTIILLVAIPETMVILGFVVAVVMLFVL